jgi:hypothetical protein
MAHPDLPIAILPTGRRLYQSDLPRFGRRTTAVVEGVVFAALLLMLLFLTTWMGPA